MELKEFKERLSKLEDNYNKYSFLLNLSPEQIVLLKTKIEEFRLLDFPSYNGTLLIDETDVGLKESFEINNLNHKSMNSIESCSKAMNVLESGIEALIKLRKELKSVIDYKYLFDFDYMKIIVDNNKKLSDSDLDKLVNSKNKKIIEEIHKFKYIVEKNRIKYNKDIDESLLIRKKKLVYGIEDRINAICFELHIDYSNMTFLEKYYKIIEVIDNRLSLYNKLIKDSINISKFLGNIESKLNSELNNNDAHITFENLVNLINIDIDEMIKELIEYRGVKSPDVDTPKTSLKI